MDKAWTAVIITAAAELAESLGSFLIDQGAPGLQTEDVGDAVRLTAHFAGEPPLKALAHYCDVLREIVPGAPPPEIRVEQVPETAWAENWKAHFSPLPIGRTLFVHPPWVAEIPPGRVGIVIDPGMAFGTGHHASTRGCLCLLEQVMQRGGVRRVLDIGTGSGILAIAAAKLGAEEIWAVDTDPDACRVALENAQLNGVCAGLHVCTRIDDVPGTFDLVLANLLPPQLIELAEEIARRLRSGGVAIGSGILTDEAPAVINAWEAAGLDPHARWEEEGWVTVACQHLLAPSPSRRRLG